MTSPPSPTLSSAWFTRLSTGLAQLKPITPFPPSLASQLGQYVELLVKWNRAYNLTAIRDPNTILDLHLLDSLTVVPYVSGQRILDVGTGAGLPGIPLALALPAKQFVLLDSLGKKTRFLKQVKAELQLANVEVVQARMEDYEASEPFDTILSRAVGTVLELIQGTQQLSHAQTEWFALKGLLPEEELAAVHGAGFISTVIPLTIPGCDVTRHLVLCRAQNP